MVASRRPTAIVEGGDYLLDLGTTNRDASAIMKRVISDAGEGKIDENYFAFLNDLVEIWEAKFLDEDEDDPTYVRFLNNLKEHGNAYMLDVSMEDGVYIPFKYEIEDDDPRELKRRTTRSQRSIANKDSSRTNMSNAPKVFGEGKGKYSSSLKEDTVDEGYRIFMNGLKVVGESVVFEYEHGKLLYYEMSDQEASADVEIGPSKQDPRTPSPTPRPREPIARPGKLNPPSTTRCHPNKCSASGNTIKTNGKEDHTWYWKKLKLIFEKPFSQKEYEHFLQQVNAQTPVEVHKETRTGGYNAVPGRLGKSYLDVYPELKQEIEQVKSHPHKVLNILRGFIFYLQCTPHGVPPPWKDESCKRMMLGLA